MIQMKFMIEPFFRDSEANLANRVILERWPKLELSNGWLVAGCLFQTVSNLKPSRPPGEDIEEYDFFYFGSQDLTNETEAQYQAHVESVLADLGITVEVANQARVHLWYPTDFGRP
jgi:uncharacterized protein